MTEESPGADRCGPCTVANASVGLLVAWLPLAAVLSDRAGGPITLAVGWGSLVTAFTAYRLVARGYLPLAEPIARVTGLHTRIGPGSNSDIEEDA